MVRLNGFLDTFDGFVVGHLQHGGSYSGAAVVDIFYQPSGQNTHRYFCGSGISEYRFGPNEALHVRQRQSWDSGPATPRTYDGFNPIMHSGQLAAILADSPVFVNSIFVNDEFGNITIAGFNGIDIFDGGNDIIGFSAASISGTETLQELYENKILNQLYLTAEDLDFVGISEKFTVASTASRSTIHFSGFPGPWIEQHEAGDFGLFYHSTFETAAVDAIPLAGSVAPADALSLGPATFVYNTASGIANLFHGSGIAFYGGLAAPTTPISTGTASLGMATMIPDLHSTLTATDAVTVWVPGLYMIFYNSVVNRGAGGTRTGCEHRVTKNGTPLDESECHTYHRNASHGEANGHKLFLAQLDAGDVLGVEFEVEVTGSAGDTHIYKPLESGLGLIRIGPKRTGSV